MISVSWFLLGSVSWSAAEYAIHRFVGHGPKRTPPRSLLARLTPSGLAAEFNREHLAHHSDPTYFAPTERKVLAAAAVVLGLRRAASFAIGFGVTYAAYEVLHRRIHTHPPRGPYGRWLRRHHLAHHYKTPRANHGVTSPVWDLVFGTEKPVERIRVPQKTAPVWLHADDADYEIVATTPSMPTSSRESA
jgi:hypothetical protein